MSERPKTRELEEAAPRPDEFLEPLDFLVSDHERVRAHCELLDRLVDDPFHPGCQYVAASVMGLLEKDLALHIADEDDLFALLRARYREDDAINDVIDLLEDEHESSEDIVKGVVAGLEAIAAGKEPELPVRFFARALTFVETQRRHMAWEDRRLIPLARERLTPDDLAKLGRSMAARRGIPYPEERPQA